MHPNSVAEGMLEGRWIATDPYGAWSLGTCSAVRLPSSGISEVEIELLGHEGRAGQRLQLMLHGLEDRTEILTVSHEAPEVHVITLPGPATAGNAILSFVPVDPPTASGELVEIRGIRLRAAR